jgi:hypothetical protein
MPRRPKFSRGRLDCWLAALAFLALSVVCTWPLGKGLGRDVPGDFGDPLLNTWILAWSAEHPGDFNAPIFAPHPLALAYSEHLTPLAILAWPVSAVSRNPLLGYDVLFLATFAASAFGMFLLVRELTGSGAAAFVAGLAFGFAPYRISAIPHLQVLSSAWMPLALFGFRRHFGTQRLAPLAGASAAWVAQNLSCGYYLLFFSPVVAAYLAWEMTVRHLWSSRAALIRVGAAMAASAIATLPFVVPYLKLRRAGFDPRSLVETQKFSADVYAYFTADPALRVWGGAAQAWPHAEGALFPGLTIAALALAAILASWRLARTDVGRPSPPAGRAAGWLLAGCGGLLLLLLLGWPLRFPANRPVVKITSFPRMLAVFGLASAGWFVLSPRARHTMRRWVQSPIAFFAFVAVAGVAMSFGPAVYARGRVVTAPSVYSAFYLFVPGFDGLRVPARFAMIVALGLAVLAGYGIVMLRHARFSGAVVAVATLLIMAESFAAPLPMNQNDVNYRQHDLAPLPAVLAIGTAAPRVYSFVRTLEPSAVLLELPLGEPAFDVRYMFYEIGHGRPLVNGYSGGAPEDYGLLTETLRDIDSRPDDAWRAIVASAASHVIVHEQAYLRGGDAISRWLRSRGALEVAAFDGDRVFQIR